MKHVFTTAVFAVSAAVFAADITDDFSGKIWGTWHPAACKVQYKKCAEEGIENTPCAEIALLPGNPTEKSAMFLKRFALTQGKEYQVTVMTKNAVAGKTAKVSLDLQAFNDKGKYVSKITSLKRSVDGEWLRLSCTFKVPKNIPTVQVLLGCSGEPGSRILFDDFSIKELNPEDAIVDHFDGAGRLDFWKTSASKASMIFEENEGKEAKGCIGILIPEGNGKSGGTLLRHIPVKQGREYTITVQVKSTGFADQTPIKLNIRAQDEKKHFLGTGIQGTGIKAEDCREWKPLTFKFKIPSTGQWAKCSYLLVMMSIGGDVPGKVLFDDFECFVNKEE